VSQILSVKPAPTAPERNINPHFPKKILKRADARKRVKRKEGKEQKSKRAKKSPRGRLQHRTKNRRLRGNQSYAKTDARATIDRRIPVTIGTTAIDRIVAPGAATPHPVF